MLFTNVTSYETHECSPLVPLDIIERPDEYSSAKKRYRSMDYLRGTRAEQDAREYTAVRDDKGQSYYQCQECRKLIKGGLIALISHLVTHTHEDPFACSYQGCSKRFTELGYLKKHEMLHQNNLIRCDQCPRLFTSLSNLSHHKRAHRGKSYVCDWPHCTKSFFYNSGLKRHKSKHTQIMSRSMLKG